MRATDVIEMAQRKRAGLITPRSQDRNLVSIDLCAGVVGGCACERTRAAHISCPGRESCAAIAFDPNLPPRPSQPWEHTVRNFVLVRLLPALEQTPPTCVDLPPPTCVRLWTKHLPAGLPERRPLTCVLYSDDMVARNKNNCPKKRKYILCMQNICCIVGSGGKPGLGLLTVGWTLRGAAPR